MEDCGFIDPLDIDEFIKKGGFKGIKNAVQQGPDKTLTVIQQAKLRGRGGAGFPTHLKWKFLKDANPSEKDTSTEKSTLTEKDPSNDTGTSTDEDVSNGTGTSTEKDTLSKDSQYNKRANEKYMSQRRISQKHIRQKHIRQKHISQKHIRQKHIRQKYIICNADEGDPGAFMDRGLIESNPLMLIEGMLICAYVTGATKGIIYIRQEYPLAEKILRTLIPKLYERGFLGKNVFHLGFDFDLEVKSGAGAFVCGEETALIRSLEGRRGQPRPRPPYPAQEGLYGCPTNINNVKTLCSAALIMRRGSEGAEWFLGLADKDLKDEESGGTILLALSGKVKYTGLVEVGFGKKLSHVIERIGGGSSTHYDIKAVQTGGPSGGCLPYSSFSSSKETGSEKAGRNNARNIANKSNVNYEKSDKSEKKGNGNGRERQGFRNLRIGYKSLQEAGSILGSGGMIVLDEKDSIVDLIDFFLEFLSSESCGQCTPCREGLKQMSFIVKRILKGEGCRADIKRLEQLAYYVKENSLCGLGQTSANPVLSSLRYFKDEYIRLIEGTAFVYEISKRCTGCHKCAVICPVDAIDGEINSRHYINQDKCIHCGSCYRACPIKAIERVRLKRID
jgi:NADH:ubiquinone oxidoreductase subunit F (NADH-binding)/Pyruvate/2-oxoacid:ferredoxin oxidoreductase delta subunit